MEPLPIPKKERHLAASTGPATIWLHVLKLSWGVVNLVRQEKGPEV